MKKNKNTNLSRNKFKKGVSVIIGYVIIVSFVIVLGVVIYSWMKSYVPRAELACPDGVSIFIEDYQCNSEELILNLKNIGTFSVGGYFIRATTSPGQKVATLDLSRNITDELAKLSPTGIRFGGIGDFGNTFIPDKIEVDVYDLNGIDSIYSIEIIPLRKQEDNNRVRLVSCKDAKIKEIIVCS